VLCRRHVSSRRTGLFLILAVILAGAVPAEPAAAQGLFDFLFGGLRTRSAPPPLPSDTRSYADPSAPPMGPDSQRQASITSGGGGAYCVRLCDGRYFPLQRTGGASAAELCQSFCPATKTKVYSGGAIDYAVAHDGSRYADLDNAFVYRQRIVPACTCNGKDAFGLARMDVAGDPTLRPGDVVATSGGLMAFTGNGKSAGAFTPVSAYPAMTKDLRRTLSALKVSPATETAGAPGKRALSTGPSALRDELRRAQLDR
jgi:hypothetical protein